MQSARRRNAALSCAQGAMTYPSAMVVRRRNRRYVTLVLLVLLVAVGWAAFWKDRKSVV